MLTSLIGLGLGAGVIAYGVAETGSIGLLFNLHGIFIVIGGVLAATLVNSDGKELLVALQGAKMVFRPRRVIDHDSLISRLAQLAQVARREGLFGVHGELIGTDSPFLKSALDIAMVSANPELLRSNLETKAEVEMHNEIEASNLFRTMGVFAPMFGLIGTIFGIVRVLQNLSNPDSIGPSMALALTSALYGIVFSNLLCVPIANKIRSRALEMGTEHAMVIEAVVDMAAGLSPALIEAKLRGVYAEWLGGPMDRERMAAEARRAKP